MKVSADMMVSASDEEHHDDLAHGVGAGILAAELVGVW